MAEPTIDQQIAALTAHATELTHKVDGMISRKDSAAAADDAKADDDARDAKLAKMVADAVGAAMAAHFKSRDDRTRRRAQCDENEEGEEGEPREKAADAGAEPADLLPGTPEWSEPTAKEHGELPPSRGDSRADARRREQAEENDIGSAQQQWDQVCLQHGRRAPAPMMGEKARSYRVKLARQFQARSQYWKDVDLSTLKHDAMLVADAQIRADAMATSKDVGDERGWLREVRTPDRTGRIISTFEGPISAPNGCLEL